MISLSSTIIGQMEKGVAQRRGILILIKDDHIATIKTMERIIHAGVDRLIRVVRMADHCFAGQSARFIRYPVRVPEPQDNGSL